jgi:tetratricopeptide (TPR) repeat protein
MKNNIRIIILTLLGMIVLTGLMSSCKSKGYSNFTTYFNTFYNEERLMKECEEEFEFQAEKKRGMPKILVPISTNPVLNSVEGSTPAFLAGLRVDKSARQAVNSKLDSILAKGSKIIAKSSKSDYIVPSLYLMAKSFFYKEEWLASQIKCSELIDKEPSGEYSPDAHLLLAMNLLMQGKYDAGLTMLSRTVDVSWLNERYDILTKAFNIEAEMALYYGDLEGAIRPYFQAIAQSDDNKQRAIWQNDMAGILYRMRKYDRAEKAFAKVLTFSPDLATEYEAKIYRASCLIRISKNYEADRILTRLDDDGKFEEWKDYVATQRLIQIMLIGNKEKIKNAELSADSAFPQSQVINAYYYEKGLLEFEKGNFVDARSYFAKTRASRTQLISQPSNKIFAFMNQREIAFKNVADTYQEITSLEVKKMEYDKQQEELRLEKLKQDSLTILDSTIASVNPNTDSNNKNKDTNKVVINETTTIDTTQKNIAVDSSNTDTTNKIIDTTQQDYQAQIDKQRINAAGFYYELARINYNIGNVDSANYYYKVAADIAPISEPVSSRYLYVYAESIRDTNVWKADSILNVIVNSQPKSEYGKIALKQLGYTEAFVIDSITSAYNSGYNLMKYKEYDFAKEKFLSIFEKYPENVIYVPKALYTLGFMYESYIKNLDSAGKYYDILIEKYPESEYAKELLLALKYKSVVDSGTEIPDSLKTKSVVLYTADTSIIHAPYDSTLLAKPDRDDGFSFEDLKNPSKLLEKTKKKLQQQLDKAKDVIDSNPDVLLDKAQEKLKGTIKIPKPEDFLPKEKKEEGEHSPNDNPPPDDEPKQPEKKQGEEK